MTNKEAVAQKTVLITGASSGIGAATAIAFAARGAHILLHYNSNRASAEEVSRKIETAGGSSELLCADLSTAEGTRQLCAALAGRDIDILVNNAGSLIARTKVLDFTEELWERVMMLNLTSAFFVAQAVLRGMVERRQGCIINVSSVAARFGGGVGALAYSSAKGAVSTMTRALAREFAPHGIRVNAISPGTVDTRYHQNFSTEEGLAAVRAATPAGRLGTAEEIAATILFLASDDASFIHGEVIEINGGFFMA